MNALLEQLRSAKLTQRQIECLSLWCFDCKSMAHIGVILSIGKGRVQKHIQAAQARLSRAGLPQARQLKHRFTPKLEHRDMDRIGPDELAK